MLCYFSYPNQAYIEDNKNHVLLPTFLDMTGFDNEETEINIEMFSILFNGKLKEGENLSSVRQFFDKTEWDVHRLRRYYSKRPVNARVDRIIVVCTANPDSPLPNSLLRVIRETAKKGSRGNVNSYVRYYQLTCQRHFMLCLNFLQYFQM
jgi:hypothetical protein